MSKSYLQTHLDQDTDNFEAFDRLTTALTHIDSYRSSQHKDTELLKQAADCISEALEEDPQYFKAQYFEAIVNYLQGNHKDALARFNRLFEIAPAGKVAAEIQYNIAVVNSEQGNFEGAIEGFGKIIEAEADPETRLLARAGLALTHANRINKLIKTESYDEKQAIRDREEIETQYLEIQKTMVSPKLRMISGEVIDEVEQIMSRALEQDVNLPRPWKRRLARLLHSLKPILFFSIAALIVLALIVYAYLYWAVHSK